jgi:hypothetical protein
MLLVEKNTRVPPPEGEGWMSSASGYLDPGQIVA